MSFMVYLTTSLPGPLSFTHPDVCSASAGIRGCPHASVFHLPSCIQNHEQKWCCPLQLLHVRMQVPSKLTNRPLQGRGGGRIMHQKLLAVRTRERERLVEEPEGGCAMCTEQSSVSQ